MPSIAAYRSVSQLICAFAPIALFKVKGSTQTGASCTASPFEVLVGGGWRRTGLPTISGGVGGAPSSKVTVPLPAATGGQPVEMLRYAWSDTQMCMIFRKCGGEDGGSGGGGGGGGTAVPCPRFPLPAVPFNVSLA